MHHNIASKLKAFGNAWIVKAGSYNTLFPFSNCEESVIYVANLLKTVKSA